MCVFGHNFSNDGFLEYGPFDQRLWSLYNGNIQSERWDRRAVVQRYVGVILAEKDRESGATHEPAWALGLLHGEHQLWE